MWGLSGSWARGRLVGVVVACCGQNPSCQKVVGGISVWRRHRTLRGVLQITMYVLLNPLIRQRPQGRSPAVELAWAVINALQVAA